MVKFPDRFETARLVIRMPVAADRPYVFDYSSNEDVVRFLSFPQAKIEADTSPFLDKIVGLEQEADERHWAIQKKGQAGLIGMISLTRSHGMMLGYVLNFSEWGKGYTAEAAQPLRDWTLTESGENRFWAVCDVENPQSASVMKKLDMQHEGTLRNWIACPNLGGPARDCLVYSAINNPQQTNSGGPRP